MEGHFILDGDLAQVETVGTHAIRMKTPWTSGLETVAKSQSNPEMLAKELLPNLEALCLWTNSFHLTQTSHQSLTFTQTWYLCITYQGTGGW